MFRKLWTLDATQTIALEWQSVYTGIQIISNWLTPSHRDSKGRPEWFDILASYCGGGSTPSLLVHDLGLDLEYSSGTVVGICGTVFSMRLKVGVAVTGYVMPTSCGRQSGSDWK